MAVHYLDPEKNQAECLVRNQVSEFDRNQSTDLEENPTTSPGKKQTTKSLDVVLWILQFIGAGIFFQAGILKLLGNASMVALYDLIGIGQWFRLFTGTIEVISAVLLLTPAFASIGGFLLVCTMLVATLLHVFIIGGNPTISFSLFIAIAVVTWFRKENLRRRILEIRQQAKWDEEYEASHPEDFGERKQLDNQHENQIRVAR